MRKISVFFCIIMVIGLLSGCGETSRIRKEINAIIIENTLPSVESDANVMADISDAVYTQQLELCSMYSDAYEKTDLDSFEQKYPDFEKDKLRSLLSEARKDMNEQSAEAFAENMNTLLANVTDCANQNAYISKCASEVSAFYDDYRRFNTAESSERNSVLCDILLKYSKQDNSLATRFITDNKKDFCNAAAELIESGTKENKDLRAKVGKCSELIDAINEIFGGAPVDIAERINAANKELIAMLLNSMESLSDSERKRLLEQLKNGEDLTVSFEKTQSARTSKQSRTSAQD